MLLKNENMKLMNFNYKILLVLFVSLPELMFCQQTVQDTLLKLSDAVVIAMEKNQDILIAKNNVRIAEVNKGVLNSGYLPSLTGTARAGYNKSNTNIKLISGNEISQNGAVSKNYSADLGLNYRLFDGMNRFYNLKLLKKNYSVSQLQARSVIENSLIRLVRSYYNTARYASKLENLKRTIKISNARLQYMRDKYNYGQATELDLLNAEVDLNNDSINYINTLRQLEIAQNDMRVIMGVDMSANFKIDTVVNFGPAINYSDILNSALNKNVDYLIAKQNIELSDLQLKKTHSGYIPRFDLNGGYAYNRNDNDVGNLLFLKSNGYNVGASLSWNIFDGGKTRVQELNAKISLENSQIQESKIRNELQRQVADAYSNYTNMLFILRTQETNKKINELNFQRSAEQYKLGQLTSLDFRKAQVNLQLAIDLYNEALYNAKVAELELIKLGGLFLDEL